MLLVPLFVSSIYPIICHLLILYTFTDPAMLVFYCPCFRNGIADPAIVYCSFLCLNGSESESASAQVFILLFIYLCIAVGDPVYINSSVAVWSLSFIGWVNWSTILYLDKTTDDKLPTYVNPLTYVRISLSFPHSWLITGFVTRLTQQVPLVEQELLTLLEHLSSPPVFSGVRVSFFLSYSDYFKF